LVQLLHREVGAGELRRGGEVGGEVLRALLERRDRAAGLAERDGRREPVRVEDRARLASASARGQSSWMKGSTSPAAAATGLAVGAAGAEAAALGPAAGAGARLAPQAATRRGRNASA
jgi:hypothetical protein